VTKFQIWQKRVNKYAQKIKNGQTDKKALIKSAKHEYGYRPAKARRFVDEAFVVAGGGTVEKDRGGRTVVYHTIDTTDCALAMRVIEKLGFTATCEDGTLRMKKWQNGLRAWEIVEAALAVAFDESLRA
jgi:hypothetical protein